MQVVTYHESNTGLKLDISEEQENQLRAAGFWPFSQDRMFGFCNVHKGCHYGVPSLQGKYFEWLIQAEGYLPEVWDRMREERREEEKKREHEEYMRKEQKKEREERKMKEEQEDHSYRGPYRGMEYQRGPRWMECKRGQQWQ